MILISSVIIMSLILLYAGLFLFSVSRDAPQRNDPSLSAQTPAEWASPSNPSKAVIDAVKYTHKSEIFNGLRQEINILEINPGMQGIRIQPVLSHDILYGFEPLSEMAARKKAYAAVNGGFFSKFGLPSGMVVIDGELLSASTGKYPVFVLENGKAALKEFKSAITIQYGRNGAVLNNTDGRSTDGGNARSNNAAGSGNMDGSSGSITADCFNTPPGSKSIAVFTPYYGQTNRVKKPNVTVTVEGGVAVKVALYDNDAEIPQNGMLISFFDTSGYSVENLPIKEGDMVQVSHQPETGMDTEAYECGCWLVRGGKPAVPPKDAWIGVLTNRDPRTAIGIKENGTVVLLTIDGRQPGYSAGFTGQELAGYLISCGVKDAAMLDGGASTEMLVEGKLVSRPSYKGEERTLGGGILVISGK